MAKSVFILIVLNFVFYFTVLSFHAYLPLNRLGYFANSHHFLPDPQISGRPFSLLSALAQYDAQWYLKIASLGYPAHPPPASLADKTDLAGPSFAFFPLHPLLIRSVFLFTSHLELSAFLLSNFTSLLCVVSLYLIISKLYKPSLAVKTILLLFSFPFSIFFRSYYAESLQLLLLLWFSYFLVQKKYLLSASFLSLLNISKGNTLLLSLYFAFLVTSRLRLKSVPVLFVTLFPFFIWLLFNYYQTGNPLYFYHAQSFWFPTPLEIPAPLYNLLYFVLFGFLPFHDVHTSQVEAIMLLASFVLLWASRPFLKKELWWVSFVIWATPFFTRDLASFSRYQSVSFPLFLYAAHATPHRLFPVIVLLSYLTLLVTSLFFVNWYWIG